MKYLSSCFSQFSKPVIPTLSFLLLILASISSIAQKKEEIIVKIGDSKVSTEEFLVNYRKNNTNILDEKDRKTPEEYLDLYINFRLKVLEAQKQGYDTVKSFIDELKGYRQELAKPYLTDVSYNEDMIKTAYHRTKYERKASHLLLLVNPDASPADTLTAWKKLADIRKQIIEGTDFNEMAFKYSEDPSAKQNKGQLSYFSAFQMVYPFENMTYRTPVGQVSEIVRTRFGYHLIKVHDERQTPGEMKVAHIMKMFPQQASDETIANLKMSADSLWKRATGGDDFEELARKYSDDKQSAPEGGLLNWFTPTNMIPAFADAAFALKNDGDISPVIRTPYGWHIIKRLELRTTLPFEKIRADLEMKIKQNPAISKYSDEAFDRKLRTEYQLKIDDTNFRKLVDSVADTLKRKELASNLLVSFANQKITTGQFVEFLQKQNFAPQTDKPKSELTPLLNKLINQKLLEYENTQLEKKHPEFARVYREYHDGILLFNISKDKIWDVASNDSARLQKYFDQTDKKYYWGQRFKGWVIETASPEIRTKVETILDQREAEKQELQDLFNTKTENNIQFRDVAVEKGIDPIVDYYIWSGPKPSGFNETTTFVHGKISQNEPKELKEAWGLYSSDFQELIEKEWIGSLKKKYPIVVNRKALKKIPIIE
jgi:peptidyl-prolyl cis-trans isomerase SurA